MCMCIMKPSQNAQLISYKSYALWGYTLATDVPFCLIVHSSCISMAASEDASALAFSEAWSY